MARAAAGPVVRSGEQFADLANGLTICFETFGQKSDPAILLVMGLGGPMGWWRAEFCEQIAGRGYLVIRMDNRDTGRSSRITGAARIRPADIVRAFVTKKADAPYALTDMAADCIGVLDHLGITQAHVVGVSLGGMIAQSMAIAHPDRVLSLVSMMSTTGHRFVGFQHPKMLVNLFRPMGAGRDAYIAASVRGHRMISSPAFLFDEEASRLRAEETYDRGISGSGVLRQMMAAAAQPDRTADLATLDLPVTVIHGKNDPLVGFSGGRATAKAIPGAHFVEIHGLAHDLPPELDQFYVDAIVRNAERVNT